MVQPLDRDTVHPTTSFASRVGQSLIRTTRLLYMDSYYERDEGTRGICHEMSDVPVVPTGTHVHDWRHTSGPSGWLSPITLLYMQIV